MGLSREWVFENLLSALSSADPLGSMLIRAAQICRGSGLVVNELGEVTRSVGSAPSHLIANWVRGAEAAHDDRTHGTSETTIGRWAARSKTVRIRQRDYVFVLAVLGEPEDGDIAHLDVVPLPKGSPRNDDGTDELGLILDTSAKLLRAFEGFETFSMSTRREESARLVRDLEAGVSPGREPGVWRVLENFGFDSYEPVRIIRARISAGSRGSKHGKKPERGIVISDSGQMSAVIERTALCVSEFDIAEHFAGADVIGSGVSEPFTALSQVPEMLRAADVALAAADSGRVVLVDEMRPNEWAAARMSSRFDQQVVRRFIQRISTGPNAWETLTAYVDCQANVAEVASRLQIHPNTVRYRLGLLEHELGGRLTDPHVAADLVIALECEKLGASEANRRSHR